MNTHQGFTLIELMVTVAIIGILSATAIVSFQNYITKTQVTRVIGESAGLKVTIDECILHGRLQLAVSSSVSSDECDPGALMSNLQRSGGNSAPTLTLPTNAGVPVVTLNIDGSATVVATFGNNASLALTNAPGAITWSRSVDGSWTCQSSGFDTRYVSSNCPM